MPHHETRQRDVRSGDPSLSPETNRRLTAELRDAVGDDAVEVPAGRADHRDEPHGTHSVPAAAAGHNRATILIAALVLLVVGAVIWVTTGSWWVMAVAVVVDLIAVGVLTATTIGMTTAVEHPSPGLAARMEEEGVADPDRLMTDLVGDFAEDDAERGNRRTVAPREDESEATAQQRSAITPTDQPSRPAGPTDAD
jgi:hypothetical protein